MQNTKTNERNLSKEDLERLELLRKSEEIKGEQIVLNLDYGVETENEAEKLLGQLIDDPITKFQLYYNGLSRLLKNNLPKGKEYEDVRRIVYDEKNILINRGAKKNGRGIRGRDGRMAYLDDLEQAIKIVASWASNKGTPAELFMLFWDKNEELGYGHQD